MSLFRNPEEHAANPPSTWQVVKRAEKLWQLQTKDGVVLTSSKTKKAAEADKLSGPYVTLYGKEGRWYRGETVHPWKPYAQVLAERARNDAWQAQRAAERSNAKV